MIRRALALSTDSMIGLDDLPDSLVIAAGADQGTRDWRGWLFPGARRAHGEVRAAIPDRACCVATAAKSPRLPSRRNSPRHAVSAAEERTASTPAQFSRLIAAFCRKSACHKSVTASRSCAAPDAMVILLGVARGAAGGEQPLRTVAGATDGTRCILLNVGGF